MICCRGKKKGCFWWKIEPGSIVNKLEVLITGKAVVLRGDINLHISSSPSFMVNQVLGCGALSEMVSTGKVQTPEEGGESGLEFLVRRFSLIWNLWGFCYLAGFGREWKISMEKWIFSYLNVHMCSSCGIFKLVLMPSLQTTLLWVLTASWGLSHQGQREGSFYFTYWIFHYTLYHYLRELIVPLYSSWDQELRFLWPLICAWIILSCPDWSTPSNGTQGWCFWAQII